MTARLTHAQLLDRAMTEAELQRCVTDLASLLGWSWLHLRPARTDKGWRTPVSGPLGAGFPDLVLVRARDRRLLFVELKREGGKASVEQAAVLAALSELEQAGCVQVRLWRPSDLTDGRIEEVLR